MWLHLMVILYSKRFIQMCAACRFVSIYFPEYVPAWFTYLFIEWKDKKNINKNTNRSEYKFKVIFYWDKQGKTF